MEQSNHCEKSAAPMACTFDGACEPYNPGGDMGLGWTVGDVGYHAYVAAAPGNSNNVAEYGALIGLLDHLLASPPSAVTIRGDSQLVICQLLGEYAVNSPPLRVLHDQASRKIQRLRDGGCRVALEWHPRAQNQAADEQSKLALREHDVQSAERAPLPGWTSRLGDIAESFDISAVALGRCLEANGLRQQRRPTPQAIEAGLARERWNGFGVCWDWHLERVTRAIRDGAAAAMTAAQVNNE